MSGYGDDIKFEELKGATIAAIEKTDEEVTMALADGRIVTLYHSQSCCENVWLEDVVGELGDLVGTPLLLAEESGSTDRPDDLKAEEYSPESETWTFYRMGTINGTVVLRWCGQSNGYYSEEVDIRVTQPEEAR